MNVNCSCGPGCLCSIVHNFKAAAIHENTSVSAAAVDLLYSVSIVIPQSPAAALRVHVQCKFYFCVMMKREVNCLVS
jgi:hypothetical protein